MTAPLDLPDAAVWAESAARTAARARLDLLRTVESTSGPIPWSAFDDVVKAMSPLSVAMPFGKLGQIGVRLGVYVRAGAYHGDQTIAG